MPRCFTRSGDKGRGSRGSPGRAAHENPVAPKQGFEFFALSSRFRRLITPAVPSRACRFGVTRTGETPSCSVREIERSFNVAPRIISGLAK